MAAAEESEKDFYWAMAIVLAKGAIFIAPCLKMNLNVSFILNNSSKRRCL